MTKYRNKRVTVDGITFDSIAESKRYKSLKLMERTGGISDLKVHVRFKLYAGIVYEADFTYIENAGGGRLVAEDVKGVETAVFKLKKKLFLAGYPDIELRIIRAEEVT